MRIAAENIFNITNDSFAESALEVFRFQYANNDVYRAFCNGIKRTPEQVNSIDAIPFLPVEFFKTHRVISSITPAEVVFTSSGTTGSITSKHEVTDLSVYNNSLKEGFRFAYGNPEEWTFLFLLPGYMDREGSSLVYMAEKLRAMSRSASSGFYLRNHEELNEQLLQLRNTDQKVMLLGVTYALLDHAEKFPIQFPQLTVMETGGMKGKRKEMTREELHSVLAPAFGVKSIHSEYGMTELLSQAYSKGQGIYSCPPWMRIRIRETHDPFSIATTGKTGGINIIDLANINSCSFISTSDLGKLYADGTFEVLGRFDHSDLRGCNLMVE
jgi:phenylacetate-coenzyme A ligase PaaK-like adenylate-forming protein